MTTEFFVGWVCSLATSFAFGWWCSWMYFQSRCSRERRAFLDDI